MKTLAFFILSGLLLAVITIAVMATAGAQPPSTPEPPVNVSKPWIPDVAKDLPGKIVAVTDQTAPGNLIGWIFDKTDAITAKIIDSRKEGYQDIYYVELTTKTKTGATLAGIAELHYITIAKKQYLIAVGSINLETAGLPPPPPPPNIEQKKEPGKLQPSQRPPGVKE